jgi:hypothetical protein
MSIPSYLQTFITKNKQLRQDYLSSKQYKDKLDNHENTTKNNKIIMEKLSKKKDHEENYIRSKSTFTLDDLNDIGTKISESYTKPTKLDHDNIMGIKNDYNSDTDSGTEYHLEEESSFETINYVITKDDLTMFENFDAKFFDLPPLNTLRTSNYNDDPGMHPRYKSLAVASRLKLMFMDCVKTLHSLGIEIYAVRKNLENYQNGGNCCLRYGVFVFSCRKNNFEFKFTFLDDGDSPSGYFYTSEIKNVINQTKIEVSCSFNVTTDYTKNHKLDYSQQKFLKLISGMTQIQFRDMFYGPLWRIPKLLEKLTEYKITVPSVKLSDFNDQFHSNKYYIKVSKNDRHLILFPSIYHGIKLYFTNVVPFQVNECRDNYRFTYKGDSDIDILIQYINEYFNKLEGNYGYTENGKYFNDKTFMNEFPNATLKILYVHHFQGFYNQSANIYCSDTLDIDNMSGFDMFFVLGSDIDEVVKINMEFVADYYGVRFTFDKRVDPFNCVLTISPMYKNAGSEKLCSFSPMVKFHESYSDCVAMIRELNDIL